MPLRLWLCSRLRARPGIGPCFRPGIGPRARAGIGPGARSALRFPALPAAAVLAALSPLAAAAQLAPSPDEPPPASTAPAQPVETMDVPTLKVTTNLVNFFFTAKDKRGALIPGLTREDCMIFEDKVPQKIKNFSAEVNLPLTLGLLLDTSGSQQTVLPMEQEAGSRFLEQVLESKDQAFLVSFDVDVNVLEDYTSSARLLREGLRKAQINTAAGNGAAGVPGIGQGPFPTRGSPKGTLLYDAIYLAANDKLRDQVGRKALIVLTDGMDQGSQTRIEGAIEAAQKANAIVYVILIADRQQYWNSYSMGYSGDSAMRRVAEETGGMMVNVGSNAQKLQAAFDEIEKELRTQYSISYTPARASLDGSFRRVEIQCRNDSLRIQSRKGYYALADQQ